MNFKDFLNEEDLTEYAPVKSSPEQQTFNTRQDARTIVQKTRGLMPGRFVDPNGVASNSPFNPDVKADPNDHDKMSLIIKNTPEEVVFVNKDENGDIFITLVNKLKNTKRTIAIEPRGAKLLKRFI